jgi:hypothetical protein
MQRHWLASPSSGSLETDLGWRRQKHLGRGHYRLSLIAHRPSWLPNPLPLTRQQTGAARRAEVRQCHLECK